MLVYRTLYDYESGREESYKYLTKYILKVFKFHLNEYAADEYNREGLIELLEQEKIEKANKSGSSLKWFGYQIPQGFEMSAEFKVRLYLGSATF